MADSPVSMPKTSNIVGYVVGALLLAGLAFAIGFGLKKGQDVAK